MEVNFYATFYFKLIVIIGVALITFLIVKIFIYTSEKRNKYLNKVISEKTSLLRDTISDLTRTTQNLEEQIVNHKKIIASISHDIRSPLQYIKLGIDFLDAELMNQGQSKDVEENIKALSDSIDKLQKFTDNILEYSKALINQNTDRNEKFNLYELVIQRTELFKQAAESKKIDLIVDIKKDFQLISNKNLLSLIIHNVLDNSLKNTFIRGKISISARRIAGKTILKIEDSGTGMDKETLEKYKMIMEKPYKKIQVSGSSMGVFIIAEASKLLDAKTEIESKKYDGTTFYLIVKDKRNEIA